MEIRNFDELVCKCNIIHELTNIFDLQNFFKLLPVDDDKQEGSFISLKYKHISRGIIGKSFPNSMMGVIVSNGKKRSFKIWRSKIQTLGCTKKEGITIIDYIIKYCRYLMKILQMIREDKDRILLNQLLNDTISSEDDSDDIIIPKQISDNILSRYLVQRINECEGYDKFKKTLEDIYSIESFTDILPKLNLSRYVMVKCNFSITSAFRDKKTINRIEIAKFLLNNGLYVKYDQCINNAVNIYINFDDLGLNIEKLKNEINRKDIRYRTIFEISKPGTITQSSPHPLIAKKAYEKICSILKHIPNDCPIFIETLPI